MYQYGVNGADTPTLNLVGQSQDAFGFGSSAPVVTSSGTTSGSALVWTVWSADGSGAGAQLRAYDPVPVDGVLKLVWSAPVGTSSKFNPPGVANNRLYVGTRDGHVLGFGSPVSAPVTAPAPTFPTTVIGQSSTEPLTITVNSAVTITSLTLKGPFTVEAPSLPVVLAEGASITVPVTFTPTTAGPVGGGLTVTVGTSETATVSLSGSGELAGPSLTSTTSGISFGGIAPDTQSSATVGFANNGSQPLTVSAVDMPAAPFSVAGAPAVDSQLQPGAEVVVNVTFAPTVNGSFSSTLELDSTGGDIVVTLTGNAASPGVLSIAPTSVDYGSWQSVRRPPNHLRYPTPGIRTLRSRSLSRPRQDHSSPPPCCPRAPRSVRENLSLRPLSSRPLLSVQSPTRGSSTPTTERGCGRSRSPARALRRVRSPQDRRLLRTDIGSSAQMAASSASVPRSFMAQRATSHCKDPLSALSPQRIMADTGWTPQMAVSLASAIPR